jgi:hypothetical protein
MLEFLWYVITVPLVLGFLIGGYLLLCTPGILVIRLIQKYGRPNRKKEAFILAACRAIFMAPVPILGHSPMILPYPFGLLAYKLDMGMEMSILWLTVPISVVFMSSVAYSALRQGALRSDDSKDIKDVKDLPNQAL